MPQQRKKPLGPGQAARLWQQLSVAYFVGAGLSLALSFLPIVRGDPRLDPLAVFFAIAGVLHLAGLRYQRRKDREAERNATAHK